MDVGAFVTRATVWLALLCYATAVVLEARRKNRMERLSRILWVAGCVFFLAHVAGAFHFYHHWSHAAAEEDTRRQTLERAGVNFRGGIYFNYLFAAIWFIDCPGWCLNGKLLHECSRSWRFVLHGFFLFMIFNATVVFGMGWSRPAGVILCLVVLVALFRARRFAQ
jgi:hypothetical protein